jgi:membrane dipeptidase
MLATSDLPAAMEARAIHAENVVIDGLFVPTIDQRLLGRLRQGGVTTVHHTVAIFESFRGLADRIMNLEQKLSRLDGAARVVLTAAEVRAARAESSIGIILGIQSPAPIEDDERLIPLIRRLGVRVVQLTYNERNLVADGCGETSDAGLSAFGHRVVRVLNQQRMVIDLSHAGERSTYEAINASDKPVIVSHSNARALCDHPRNLTDDVIRAVAARGGVIGVNAFPGFVLNDPDPKPTVEHLVDHVGHIANLVGSEHVGTGFDIDEPDTPHADYLTPDGELGVGRHPFPPSFLPPWPWSYAVPSVADFPRFTEALMRRGFSRGEIAGILGGNFMRVFEQVWGE